MEDISTSQLLKPLEQLYLAGNYQGTIDKLLEMRDQLDLGIYYYNLGTLQAKVGDMGAARYSLEQAQSYGFNSTTVKNNLNFVKNNLAQNGVVMEYSSPKDKMLEFSSSFGMSSVLIVSLLFVLVTQAIYFFAKRKWDRTLVVLIFIFILPIAAKFYVDQTFIQAVTLKDGPVYEGPSQIFEKKLDIKSGAKLVVKNNGDGWYLIQSPQEYIGWILGPQLAFLRNKQ
ncbi:MAG: hypothetical protein COW00_05415 [Bdellovibrio sp. CG12_big_fil_rev_8_21_14_0_65_39_13]|nr:MAG: hypothetical protein COW78_17950 [Bdellovibrio sp. CG22_combo_CG10-13_8_21_14_all_39_27]PIQ60671.1 MAG: hypothetical protein COW00_05415 [Bdellovibrio sp. CG12_big_fil_rev_8_21_14_0_65_39_13]PIR37055.1 MAG: hypothetical protein COV37_00775 [Bdellovibrio sp. CG11_big_fil_rev_8_21_14_0_20_39_38]PJB52421.1 MAG: hypothetical protein CO099_12590 [Bdellovibrio sp. CG_4_9_14_3_um_filter_39_7]